MVKAIKINFTAYLEIRHIFGPHLCLNIPKWVSEKNKSKLTKKSKEIKIIKKYVC